MMRILTALIAVAMFVLGAGFLFAPGLMTAQFGVFPSGSDGYSSARGDFGALFLGNTIFLVMAVMRRSRQWLTPPIVSLGLVAFGRVVSLILDGRGASAPGALAVELLMLVVLGLAWRSFDGVVTTGPSRLRVITALIAIVAVGVGAAALFQRQIGLKMVERNLDRAFSNPLLASLPDELHAGLCGSSAPLPDPNRAGPCIFVIAGKRVYIVDAGEGSARKLGLMGITPGAIDAIFLTHFHSDHIGGLGEMLLQRWTSTGHSQPADVYGPQGVDSVVDGFRAAYTLDAGYRVAHHGADTMPPSGTGGHARPFQLTADSNASQVVLEQDGLVVRAFPVPHAPVFPAVGYRFEYKGRSIAISGDTSPSDSLVNAAQGVDVLFHEGLQTSMVTLMHNAAERHGRKTMAKITADIPPYHTTPEDAARIAERAHAGQLVFYHIIPPLAVPYLNAAFLGDAPKLFHGPITVGKDGLLLSLPSGSKAIAIRELL